MFLFTSTIINITSGDISDMLGWTTAIIDDLKSMWLLILGVLLGLTVLTVILHVLSSKKD